MWRLKVSSYTNKFYKKVSCVHCASEYVLKRIVVISRQMKILTDRPKVLTSSMHKPYRPTVEIFINV